MPRKNELEFANFILKFGDERVLVDLLEEIVIPAFMSGSDRSYGETVHFFHDVEILNLGDEDDGTPVICITGRYIKNTVVKREQIFDEETDELVKDAETLHTSPSAIFILILNNHRLIYFSETSYAPSLKSFEATTIKFLKEEYQKFVEDLYRENQHVGITKKQLYEEYQPPNLEIVPLASGESISEFISQYSLLKTVEIKLLETNNEIDNNDLFRQIRRAQEEVHSSKTTITHNNGKDGLSKQAVTRQLESAINQGNSTIKLKGKDRQGNKLEGSNENFKIKSYMDEIPSTVSETAQRGYEIFKNLAAQGIIQIGRTKDSISDKMQEIKDKIDKGL